MPNFTWIIWSSYQCFSLIFNLFRKQFRILVFTSQHWTNEETWKNITLSNLNQSRNMANDLHLRHLGDNLITREWYWKAQAFKGSFDCYLGRLPCLSFSFPSYLSMSSHTAVSLSVWAEGYSSTAAQLRCSLLWLCLFCCYRKGLLLWYSRYWNVWLLPTRHGSSSTFLWGRRFH